MCVFILDLPFFSELFEANNNCLVMFYRITSPGRSLKLRWGTIFFFPPLSSSGPYSWQCDRGLSCPWPLRRLGLRAVVQTSQWRVGTAQPSLSITELNVCSRTGDAPQRGQRARTLLPPSRGKERSLMGFRKGCHILTSLNRVIRDTRFFFLCDRYCCCPRLSSSILSSPLVRRKELCFPVFNASF